MKWGVLFHMAMSTFIYSNKRLLTPIGYTTEMHFRPKGEPPKHFFKRRFDNSQAFSVALITLLILFVYFFWRTIVVTIINILALRKEKRKQMDDKNDEANGGDLETLEFKKRV
jgi:hypothetical protein